jgi:nucleoside 2-deoxyribosyltransferase
MVTTHVIEPLYIENAMVGQKVYVASPLGFTAATRDYYERRVLGGLRDAGCVPLDPWAGQDGPPDGPPDGADRAALAAWSLRVGQRNAQLIDESDAVLAILDGPDVDSGTAAEVGYAAARGKPIAGVRDDLRQAGDNLGVTVNLQVEYFIRSTGGAIAHSLEEGIECLAALLRH